LSYWGLVLNGFASNTSPGSSDPLSGRSLLPRKSDVGTPMRCHLHIYEMSAIREYRLIICINIKVSAPVLGCIKRPMIFVISFYSLVPILFLFLLVEKNCWQSFRRINYHLGSHFNGSERSCTFLIFTGPATCDVLACPPSR